MKNTDDYIKEGYREYRKWGSWNTAELILILILLFVCGFILYNYMQEHNKTIEAEKKIETMEKEIGAETTVKGVPVDSDTEIDITSIINQYFTRGREGSGWIELDNYCASGSTVYKTESGYRIRSKESYDTDDCLSRGIKEFATFIKLNRITNITEDEVFGTIIEIKHKNNIISKYSSLKNADVSIGDTVQPGEVIGTSGSNKVVSVSQNCLLLEIIKDGEYVNPNKLYNKSIKEK